MKTKLLLLLKENTLKLAVCGFYVCVFLITIQAKANNVKQSADKYTLIPDEKFEQILIKLGYDSGEIDHKVLTANIAGVINLDVSSKQISDLTGLQDFTALTELNCSQNQLTKLDLSKNVLLTSLDCRYNQLTVLDLSKNAALVTLYCTSNPLGTLDLTKNIALSDLQCENNKLSTLDLSKNTSLTMIWCNRNQITDLDISQNIALSVLRCFGNQLTTIDASKNPSLTYLDCKDNKLVKLNVQNGNNVLLQYFEVEGNPGLLCIQADTNKALNSNWSKDKTAKYSKTACIK